MSIFYNYLSYKIIWSRTLSTNRQGKKKVKSNKFNIRSRDISIFYREPNTSIINFAIFYDIAKLRFNRRWYTVKRRVTIITIVCVYRVINSCVYTRYFEKSWLLQICGFRAKQNVFVLLFSVRGQRFYHTSCSDFRVKHFF